MTFTNTGSGFGHVIDGEGGSAVDLGADEVVELIARHGVVLLRNFRDGVANFEPLTDLLGRVRPANIRPATGRQFESNRGTQAINAGQLAVPLHAESYFTPICPQILAFVCVENTATGGETVLCDGRELFDGLRPDDRDALVDQDIVWDHQSTVAELEAQTQQSVGEFVRACAGVERCDVSVEDDLVSIHYVAPSIRRSWWGGERTFANNLIPIGKAGVLDTMVPGLAGEVVERAERQAAEITVGHAWRPEDVVLIDNTRVMHGRNPWSGGGRHLRVRMLTVETG